MTMTAAAIAAVAAALVAGTAVRKVLLPNPPKIETQERVAN